MNPSITKAMVLAAGLGTRLRPLTHVTPKPLLPVRGKPLLDHILAALVKSGVREVMLNLHHLPDQIRRHVGDGASFGLRAHYSFEPKILGTGGGLKQCETFFADDSFFLVNGDIFSDVHFSALAEAHGQHAHAAATLVVRALQPDQTFTPVRVAQGEVRAIGNGTHHYAGIMIGTPQLLKQLPVGASCLINDGIMPLLRQSAVVGAYEHTGEWNDIGTLKTYEALK